MTDWPLKEYFLFVGLYLLLSLPAFLVLNWDIVAETRDHVFPASTTIILALVIVLVFLAYLFFLADDGVDRYVHFLATPTDLLSVLIILSFLWAAISWWAIPELVFLSSWTLSVNELVLLIIVSQLPMVLFLSLMTAIGRAGRARPT